MLATQLPKVLHFSLPTRMLVSVYNETPDNFESHQAVFHHLRRGRLAGIALQDHAIPAMNIAGVDVSQNLEELCGDGLKMKSRPLQPCSGQFFDYLQQHEKGPGQLLGVRFGARGRSEGGEDRGNGIRPKSIR